MRLFLMGFMGCGKSYLGKKIAENMGFGFIDADLFIEDKAGVTIAQIFENQGETYFRQLESDILKSLSAYEKVVIATGGGAPCFHDNIAWMNAHGTTLYLKTDPLLLLNRLKREMDKRPLLRGKSEGELLQFINLKVAERAFFYNQAHIIIEQNHDFMEADVERIVNMIDSIKISTRINPI